ncbi:MAG TPA: hypothetical protein VHG28_13985 [Longimicrobiaceae bacterium]|nr:hypothetical protein [Longimicrobiaceae bacterium]
MNILKLLLGGAAVATILVAFRDFDSGGWLLPGGEPGEGPAGVAEDEEPVLGYDGMDRDAVIDWLREARPNEDTLLRIHEYEVTHKGRALVLETISDMLA